MKRFHVIPRATALLAAALFVTGCAGTTPEAPTSTAPSVPVSVPVPVATGEHEGSGSVGSITVTPPPAEDTTNAASTSPSPSSNDKKAAETSGRFVMDGVSLDVPLKTQPWADVLSPGDHTSMWALVDESKGWVWDSNQIKLVTTHACSLRECPGNKLLTEDNKPAVSAGEILYMDGDAYEIQDTVTIQKEEVIESELYESKPGKLLIVTCRPNEDGTVSTATHNVVITAQKVTP